MLSIGDFLRVFTGSQQRASVFGGDVRLAKWRRALLPMLPMLPIDLDFRGHAGAFRASGDREFDVSIRLLESVFSSHSIVGG